MTLTETEQSVLRAVVSDNISNVGLTQMAATQVARLHTFGLIYYNGDQYDLRLTPKGERYLAAELTS